MKKPFKKTSGGGRNNLKINHDPKNVKRKVFPFHLKGMKVSFHNFTLAKLIA